MSLIREDDVHTENYLFQGLSSFVYEDEPSVTLVIHTYTHTLTQTYTDFNLLYTHTYAGEQWS